jgi:arginyl-tRNA synthetase
VPSSRLELTAWTGKRTLAVMTDPITSMTPAFRAAIAAAFGPDHANADPALRRSDRADYQANAALALRKQLGGTPRDIAAKIAAHLDLAGIAESVDIAGAGFLNITLTPGFLSREVTGLAGDSRLGVAPDVAPEVVAIDYSSPNVAKEMHVGNIRSTIIGDSLARVLEATGHRVVRQNHLGDWGTPFGMLLEHLVDSGEQAADVAARSGNAFYQEARRKFDEDPSFADRARRRVVLLQGGDAATLSLWRGFVDASKRYLATVYDKLGLTLTEADIAGESIYNAMLPGIVEELSAKGLAVESEGALCVFPKGFTTKTGEPLPLIVRKNDGGYGYATTDLAAVRRRVETLGARRLVYVVGSPQSQHLAMVFAVATLAGWLAPPVRAEHVAFGSVLGSDRKVLRTREGEAVRLVALLDEAIERARAVIADKNPDLDPASRESVARAVGIGSIKYADLSSDRIKDYVFDWNRMLAFEGNTAPYLQYAHARIRSILRRAGEEAPVAGSGITIVAPAERSLAIELLGFGTAVHEVARTLEPHRLCTYLYGLATAFSGFYEACPVLKAATPEERASRLALSDLTARVLARGLGLLGIDAPDRM